MQQTVDPNSRRILGVSTLAFTVCFAVWSIFSIIGFDHRHRDQAAARSRRYRIRFPFSRLVHIWSAPLGYIARPYQVVRRRGAAAAARGR
jgi:hypothetical protein